MHILSLPSGAQIVDCILMIDEGDSLLDVEIREFEGNRCIFVKGVPISRRSYTPERGANSRNPGIF